MSNGFRTLLPSKPSVVFLILSLVLFLLAMTFGCASYTDDKGVVHKQLDVGFGQRVLNDPAVQTGLNAIPFGIGSVITGVGSLLLYGVGVQQNKTRREHNQTIKEIATSGFKALGESLQKSTSALAVSSPVGGGSSSASVGL